MLNRILFLVVVSLNSFAANAGDASGVPRDEAIQAVQTGKLNVVRSWISTGALTYSDLGRGTVGWKDLIHVAAEAGQTEILNELLNLEVRAGDHRGINASSDEGYTALQYAAANDQAATVRFLISYMIDSYAPRFWTNKAEMKHLGLLLSVGQPSALEIARSRGNREIVALLEKYGAR